MRKITFMLMLAGLTLTAVACGGGDSPGLSANPTVDEVSTSTPPSPLTADTAAPSDPTPTNSATSASPSTGDPAPVATLELPEPFDPADYYNGDDIAKFLDDLGSERGVPAALADGAPELERDVVTGMWADFLRNSRVFEVKRDRIVWVIDNCVKTKTVMFDGESGRFEGLNTQWSIRHTEYGEWNRPRLVEPNPMFRDRAAFLRDDYDRVSGGVLTILPEEKLAHYGSGSDETTLRVFDHPNCKEIAPILAYSPAQWDLLGIGVSHRILDYLSVEEDQLPPDEWEERWHEALSDIVIFRNLNEGELFMISCADGTGFNLDRFDETRLDGKPMTWQVVDGSDYARNAAWIIMDYTDPDDPFFAHREQLLIDLESLHDPYIAVLANALPGCSVELGEQMFATLQKPE